MCSETIPTQIEWEHYVAARDEQTRLDKGILLDTETQDRATAAWRTIRDIEQSYHWYDFETRYAYSIEQLQFLDDGGKLYQELSYV